MVQSVIVAEHPVGWMLEKKCTRNGDTKIYATVSSRYTLGQKGWPLALDSYKWQA